MKYTKNNNSKVSKDFSAREVGVLLESMEKNISVIAEQHGDIDKKLDILAKNHLEVVERLGDIDNKLNADYVKREEFVVLEKRVASVEKSDLD